MMESAPPIETVCAAIGSLYHNPDPKEKEQASVWLQSLQKSVYAWKVSDEILHRKPDVESCYIAAQTMRTKIQNSFHEVPVEAHISLRDSLLEHIQGVDEATNAVIVTQLSLALADLILQMPEWKNAVPDLVTRLQHQRPWALLEILVVLPEEVSSRHLRLGANRRNEILEELKTASGIVNDFLNACVSVQTNNYQYKLNAFKCLTSWLQIGAIHLEGIDNNVVLHEALRSLANVQEYSMTHEAASDCVIALLVRLEEVDNANDMTGLELSVFTLVRKLEEPYHLCVASEDLEKALNLCRVFVELGETFLSKMMLYTQGPHFAVSILDNVLICCGHPDYEIPDITFNLWYRLSEELYQRNDDHLTNLFRPYIERLINALCRHCQMEPDSDGILEDGDDFSEFRSRVVELIKDVVFIVGSANVFKHMFAYLSQSAAANSSWETAEAALFLMAAVARNLFPNENENVPPVMECVLNSTQNQHMAVRHTSIRLVGELGEWVNHHPEYLERILNWLVLGLNEPRLASQSATALQNVCSMCQRHMTPHFEGLVQIIRSLDSFQLKPLAAAGLLKGVAVLVSGMPFDRIEMAMKTLIDLQLQPLAKLTEAAATPTGSTPTPRVVKNSPSDPVLYLDRLSAVFRHINLNVEPGQGHPAAGLAVNDVWPVVTQVFSIYAADSRIMERTCRTLRFVIRCVGTQSAPLVEPLVKMLVSLYIVHPHSCFLYLGSILVDEYAHITGCVAGLLEMLRAFLPPTFALLNTPVANNSTNGEAAASASNNNAIGSLKNHPDTVDDFFRLNARFLQRASMPYLECDFIHSILDCALAALYLDHKDANGSVMKFFFDLLHLGRSKEDRDDYETRSEAIHQIRQDYGSRLVDSLVNAAIFHLPSYTFHDIGDVLMELMLLERTTVCMWLEATLKNLPGQQQHSITHSQLVKFHKQVTTSEDSSQVSGAVREFSRLWR